MYVSTYWASVSLYCMFVAVYYDAALANSTHTLMYLLINGIIASCVSVNVLVYNVDLILVLIVVYNVAIIL